nr:reverse transcriptase domain-containing protein [Tanacetum cinerariifolium]
RHGLIRGLPKLKFEKDHLCSAYAIGKSKKKPHKPKSEDTKQEKLYILHTDLYGPMRVQNGTTERRNHTLIEVSRTMLIYAKASLFLWAEAVATARDNVPSPSAWRLFKAWQLNNHKKNSSISSKPDRAYICTISGAFQYFSEDYDEEKEMEPRSGPARAVTPPLQAASPRVRRRRERVVRFEETQNKGESKVERNSKGKRPSKEAPRGNGSQNVNLPPLLAAHIERSENGQHLQSSLTSVYGGQALPNKVGGNLPLNAHGLPSANSNEKPLYRGNLCQPPTKRERTIDLYKRKLTPGSKKERWTLMASQVIEEIVSKDQRNPPMTTTEERKTKTGSPPLKDRTTACSPICPKVKEKFVPQKESQKASNHLPRCSKANDHEIPPRQLSHLVKGIKKEKAKSTDTPEGKARKTKKMGIVVSTIHGAIKFHTKKGVRTVLLVGEAREETRKARRTLTISKERIPSCDDTEEKIIVNDKYLEQMNKQSLGPDHNAAACKEPEELTKAGLLRKVKHQMWVANTVMVKKNDGGWRMCVDFTDINKACPKV